MTQRKPTPENLLAERDVLGEVLGGKPTATLAPQPPPLRYRLYPPRRRHANARRDGPHHG